MSNKNIYTIGDFAQLTGLSPDTLRFYEQKGLVKPQRGNRNLRLYNDDDLEHVAMVRRMKMGGFSLDEILEYTTFREQGLDTIHVRMSLMRAKIAALHEKQQAIDSSIEYLEDKLKMLADQDNK
ncbi:hypothetical protein FC70_GL001254 [Paucilactobacillus oligofermentans DSM 15707 = LMG 22743]|uniref:HTH merR-type domain-containing protein n=1 Tax=Paucilactobacillus oligofermentans DSM 15707 = LMG 22743 TaxID=1423778 RepID=A0A0R1RQL0_9LACO|nr:MerR family transcriptional regulator [Paucilactobacillus oligofermentans]KRL55651.1 hypothetical protein FC70_GL001254 [Paucilactobacillus oligofermentans DSM 15707 = LMG 22743]CUS25360.1 Transcriptional regulator MerR [Paucilactobacillus oligofermentans DSM 15707 = LMG 22743]